MLFVFVEKYFVKEKHAGTAQQITPHAEGDKKGGH
jgi:hypothetical protein